MLTDGVRLFTTTVQFCHLWWHPWEWVDRRVHLERNAETQRGKGWICLYNHCPVKPTSCGRLQEIHGQRSQPLFHRRPPEVRFQKWHKNFWRELINNIPTSVVNLKTGRQESFIHEKSHYDVSLASSSPITESTPYELRRAQELNAHLGPKGSEEAVDLLCDMHNTTSNMGLCIIFNSADWLILHICKYLQVRSGVQRPATLIPLKRYQAPTPQVTPTLGRFLVLFLPYW